MSAKQPTLLNLPIEIANQVLEKLHLLDMLTCRKVCRSLRTAVDKIETHSTHLTVQLRSNHVSICVDRIETNYYYDDDSSNCFNRKQKAVEGVDCMNAFFNDLKLFLKYALYLEVWSKDIYREHFVSSLVDILREEENNIHVETIELLQFYKCDAVLLILPLLNSQTLRSIKLRSTSLGDGFERIACLDQWKKAKKFSSDTWLDCSHIEHFFHFEEFSFRTEPFPIQNVIKVRDDLLQRCMFQNCTIVISKLNWKPVEFARIFQPDCAGGDTFTLHYSNDNSNFEIRFGVFDRVHGWLTIGRC
ncbi:F-box domain-containing protein [Caenorhabditis elegans]|uniref:F-box domain-containing protein n=1 Tax=Caenorhabditis elegans TaxID=6239 RepID=A4F333_CAEEL|nr:F-box domain-containing protein [Caenorhabditis elegans]CCD73940.1 F-box domain-containing protein [Caenorhabditis elegans]|eukprot:NP_497370.1 F-box A protein [Caenorhabditis elegans]